MAETKSKRGGSRKHPADCKCGNCPKIGRRKLTPEVGVADGDKTFATRVLARIGKPGWTQYADLAKVKNDEDYALYLLLVTDGFQQFHRLMNRKYGKEVQRWRLGNPDGEKLKVEVDVTSARDKLIASLLG